MIPISLLIIYLFEFLIPDFFSGWKKPPDRSVDYDKPLIQDRDAFLKAQPFFCVECQKFTDTIREYCEHCGTKNSLRKATKRDFDLHIKK